MHGLSTADGHGRIGIITIQTENLQSLDSKGKKGADRTLVVLHYTTHLTPQLTLQATNRRRQCKLYTHSDDNSCT